jgi:hypothetical protein
VSPVGIASKSSARSCSSSQSRVVSSEGKIPPVAPSPSAADALLPQQLEDDVLGLNPRSLQLALEEDADELRARQLERVASHADGDVEAAGAHRDHRARARLGRVAVGSDEGLTRLREPLAMDVVADPVSGA